MCGPTSTRSIPPSSPQHPRHTQRPFAQQQPRRALGHEDHDLYLCLHLAELDADGTQVPDSMREVHVGVAYQSRMRLALPSGDKDQQLNRFIKVQAVVEEFNSVALARLGDQFLVTCRSALTEVGLPGRRRGKWQVACAVVLLDAHACTCTMSGAQQLCSEEDKQQGKKRTLPSR